MTKQVRIENADTSNHPVRVTAQVKNEAGEWVDEPGYTQINNPTAMVHAYIHAGRRIIIEERDES
jgi:hypothetical protein